MKTLRACFAMAASLVTGAAVVTVAHGRDAPPPASAFGATPEFTYVALSPDGRAIAMDRTTASGRKVVLFRPGETQPLRVVNVGTDAKLRGLSWLDGRTVLVDASATMHLGGGPSSEANQYEVWRTLAFDTDGQDVRTLLLDDASRTGFVTGAEMLPIESKQPHSVFMVTWTFSLVHQRPSIGSRLTESRRDDGWVSTVFAVDTDTGKGRILDQGTPYTAQWLVNPDGEPIARSEWKPDTRDLTVLANDSGRWHPIYERRGWDNLWLAGVTADGRSVVAVGENGAGASKAWALPLDGAPARVLFEEPGVDVTGAVTDERSGVVLGFDLGGMDGRVVYTDPARAALKNTLEKAFPGRDVSIEGLSRDEQRLLVRVESPSDPTVYYLIDRGTHQAQIVGETYPGLVGATLGEVREIHYPARDGTPIPAYLTLPPGRGDKHLPMVVLVHGGPESRDHGGFDWWAQFLATRGYAVLQPQFRGSSGFGASFRQAGYQQWGRLMQDDVTDGVRYLIAGGTADPARICIAGGSYGGYAALAGAAFTPDLYACAVSFAGVSDLPKMIGDVQNRKGEQSDALAYWKDDIGSAMDPKVINASPARAAGSIRARILLMHGRDDTVVPPSQSEAMARALEAAGKPCEYVTLPGEDHWLSSASTRTEVLERMDQFLARYLRPD
jgi:dipeptidyl aminopeptidase/acylaminoacyl peptidase